MSDGIAAFRLSDPALHAIAEKVLAGERLDAADGRGALRHGRSARPRAAWPTSPTRAGTATGSSSPPTSTSIRPTSASSGTPACSAPSRGCRRKRAPTPARWRRCSTRPSRRAACPRASSTSSAGSHPKLRLSYYTDMIRGLKERHPAGAHQGAHRGRDRAPRADREDLRARGAGRAARRRGSPACRAAAPRCSAPPCAPRSPSGSSPARSGSGCTAIAHELGIPTNCTMLYGHVETAEDRIEHLAHAARPAGRDRRLPHLHPAGLPSRPQRAGRGAGPGGHRHDRLRGPEEHRRRRGCSSTTSRTSRPTGRW